MWTGTRIGRARFALTKASVLPAAFSLAPNAAPFGNWTDFQAVVGANLRSTVQSEAIETHFSDFSVRLAGPVFKTSAGPATLTLLAERRIEDVPGYTQLIVGFPGAFIGAFFTGSLLIETLFSLDGLGLLSYQSVVQRDYPVVLGTLYLFTLIGLATKLISDLCYVWVDPRIQFEQLER